MGATDDTATWDRATRPAPVAWAWLVAIGVDLAVNAGLLAGVFDQAREPSLLPDGALFARIPVAYVVVAVVVAILAWLVDRLDVVGPRRGAQAGAAVGLLLGLAGPVWLWTAIDLTPQFVVTGVVVQVAQLAAAGAVLGAVAGGTARRTVRLRSLGAFAALVVVAVVAQNVR